MTIDLKRLGKTLDAFEQGQIMKEDDFWTISKAAREYLYQKEQRSTSGLMPCPFCKHDKVYSTDDSGFVGKPHANWCGKCYAQTGGYITIEEANLGWNTRAYLAEKQAAPAIDETLVNALRKMRSRLEDGNPRASELIGIIDKAIAAHNASGESQ